MTATAQRRTLIWDNELDVDARAKLPRPVDDFRDHSGELQPYKLAPELTRIATALIEEHPNRFGHLRQFAVLYLWGQTLGAARGALKWWEVVVPKKLLLWSLRRDEQPDIASANAIVVVSLAACKEAELTNWEWEGLVYAILRTIEDNDEGGVRVKPLDDVAEAEVAARYGEWTPRLKRLVEALADGPSYQHRMDLLAVEQQQKAEERAGQRVKDAVKAALEGVIG